MYVQSILYTELLRHTVYKIPFTPRIQERACRNIGVYFTTNDNHVSVSASSTETFIYL